ncbi:MAG TPA: 4-(cytidine 5'-diphospho)-2-C-methyl-D-erythritol kinase [Phycisphaerae bacterium]|nr:4-(cytidine 5'-diphospho)-2-C-methyl-D-erythritol kinase [Phycisphaerae bacterium]HNU45129.1 4-(cytidine 5'-diphospho)-2-C-methyl-D-erythritol kinase [Phycisphaerae bacterium]
MSEGIELTTQAPAKLNLTLEVLGRRADGYHDLRSLVVGIGLCDALACVPRGDGRLKLACDDVSLAGPENLVTRAAECLAERCERRPGVRFELSKRIPVGGGLGGGSSDAAAALRLLRRLWRPELPREALSAVAASVGSDVPLFLALPAAVMTGRGERVEPVGMGWRGWALLVWAGMPVSTAAVYRAWRPTDQQGSSADAEAAARTAQRAAQLAPWLRNDLEPAVFRVEPRVAEVHEQLLRLRIGPVRVSGAGSVLYTLFDDQESAQATARRVEAAGIGAGTFVVPAPVPLPPIVSKE